jgi:hypothetical protein
MPSNLNLLIRIFFASAIFALLPIITTGMVHADALNSNTSNTNTGSSSTNINNVAVNDNSTTTIVNTANVSNNVTLNSNTGNNTTTNNTTVGNVSSGDVVDKVTINNNVNGTMPTSSTTITTNGTSISNVNGLITTNSTNNLLSTNALNSSNSNTGQNSVNSNNLSLSNSTSLFSLASANVNNNVNAVANTGNNTTSNNTTVGNVSSGSITTTIAINNQVNQPINDGYGGGPGTITDEGSQPSPVTPNEPTAVLTQSVVIASATPVQPNASMPPKATTFFPAGGSPLLLVFILMIALWIMTVFDKHQRKKVTTGTNFIEGRYTRGVKYAALSVFNIAYIKKFQRRKNE